MEPRDAYRRPEVFAFCDARMLGAFTTTSRSAKTAAHECDAWQAIARRQYERPAYFGGEPGSNEHTTFLARYLHAPEYYEDDTKTPGSNTLKRLLFITQFIKAHSRSIRIMDGDAYDSEAFDLEGVLPLRDMTILPDPGEEFLVLNGRSASPSVPPVASDVPDLGWPPAWARVDESDDDDDSDDGDSSIDGILAAAVQRLRS